ncbi:MAG: HEAT repeat domain-containing protein [Dehalococcoidia bacterium]|nr:HEAT repeat domain-containing protein [Dehalococcoidia bacterium]
MKKDLAEISDENKPLVSSKLANLSTLSTEELKLFLEAWASMDVKRRRQIISQFVELAEANPKVNFDNIFLTCLHDPDEIVRAKSIEGLWECEHCSLIDLFITLLREDSKELVRAAAAIALGKFAMLAELEKLRPEDRAKVERALLAVIDDQQLEVRRRAIEAIAPLSLPRVKEIIQEAYESDDAGMRVSAIHAMGRNCDPAWLPTLVRELGSIDAEMRYEAAVACGELGEEGAVPHLVKLIRDLDSQVRLSAIAALGKLGGSEAGEALRECLNHPDEPIREAAEEALEELGFGEDPFSFRIA